MIFAKVKYMVKPGKREDFIRAVREYNIQQRFESQPGCLLFDFYSSVNDNQNYELIEIWQDRTSFEAHMTCDVYEVWDPIKNEFTNGSSFSLYEGDRNPEYAASVGRKGMKAEN